MALNFNSTSAQRISFPLAGANVSKRLQMFWAIARSSGSTGELVSTGASGLDYQVINIDSSLKISLVVNYSTTDKNYECNDAVTAGALFHFACYYDNSSAANVPTMFLNGTSRTVNTINAGAGSLVTGDGGQVRIGSLFAPSFTGHMFSHHLFDCANYTASEVKELVERSYASKLALFYNKGLLLNPNLSRAEGVTGFDGAVLGSSSFIYDHLTGLKGTPNASPVGRSDEQLIYQGVN